MHVCAAGPEQKPFALSHTSHSPTLPNPALQPYPRPTLTIFSLPYISPCSNASLSCPQASPSSQNLLAVSRSLGPPVGGDLLAPCAPLPTSASCGYCGLFVWNKSPTGNVASPHFCLLPSSFPASKTVEILLSDAINNLITRQSYFRNQVSSVIAIFLWTPLSLSASWGQSGTPNWMLFKMWHQQPQNH